MKPKQSKMTRKDKIYTKVTNQIIAKVEAIIESGEGAAPWQRPWNNVSMPMNYTTRKAYRGINIWITMFAGFESPYWLTYKQAEKLGGNVIKGQKGTTVIFWLPSVYEKEEENKKTGKKEMKLRRTLILKEYTIFNSEQVEGVEFEAIPLIDIEGAPSMDEILAKMPNKPEIKTGGDRAYYAPGLDYIQMPPKGAFKGQSQYYSTLCHELIHSTGHADRLNREEVTSSNFFGSHEYSCEELTAEMGASFLMAITGLEVEVMDNSITYLKNWLKRLRNDKEFIFQASSKAQKAVDYIQNTLVDYSKQDKEKKSDKGTDVSPQRLAA